MKKHGSAMLLYEGFPLNAEGRLLPSYNNSSFDQVGFRAAPVVTEVHCTALTAFLCHILQARTSFGVTRGNSIELNGAMRIYISSGSDPDSWIRTTGLILGK